MFLKSIVKRNKATGDIRLHYRLCESYRFDNTVRHHTIIHLGALEELPDVEQKKALARRIEQLIQTNREGNCLFELESSQGIIEALAQKYYAIIKEKERIDIAAGKDYHRVDVNSVKNKESGRQERNGFAFRRLSSYILQIV